MAYDNQLIAAKLRRWETYIDHYSLPTWEQIPDFGLYMDQVITLLGQYLDYLPPELKEEQFITAATINNYVRTKIMPEPIKKRYYRQHLAYLIMILTLKQSMSIAMIHKLFPTDLSKEELETIYRKYVERHSLVIRYFSEQVRQAAGIILQHEHYSELATDHAEDMIVSSAIISGFSHLLAEKLLLLEGQTLDDTKDDHPETREQ